MPKEHLNIKNLDSEPEHHSVKSKSATPEFNIQNVLLLILSIAVIGFAINTFKPGVFKGSFNVNNSTELKINDDKSEAKGSGYSAVFLTNNQVYFGKLSDENSNYPKLKDVFYLRANRQLQPPPATESAQPDVSLVKLGNELHGPLDEIRFNRSQILFLEEIKTDSRIYKAIEEFKGR